MGAQVGGAGGVGAIQGPRGAVIAGPVISCSGACPAGLCKIEAGSISPNSPKGPNILPPQPPKLNVVDPKGQQGSQDQATNSSGEQDVSGSSSEQGLDSSALEAGDSGGNCVCVRTSGPTCPDGSRKDKGDGGKSGTNFAQKPNPDDPGAKGEITKIGDRNHLNKQGEWSDGELAEFAEKYIKGKKGLWRPDAEGKPGYVYSGELRGRPLEGILTPSGVWVSVRPPK
jgi:hypothetical protein